MMRVSALDGGVGLRNTHPTTQSGIGVYCTPWAIGYYAEFAGYRTASLGVFETGGSLSDDLSMSWGDGERFIGVGVMELLISQ